MTYHLKFLTQNIQYPKKKFNEETFYEWKHCTKDYENLIVKLKQEIIKLQKINKGKNILIDDLSFKVSDLVAEYKKRVLMKKLCHVPAVAKKKSSEHILGYHIKNYLIVGCESTSNYKKYYKALNKYLLIQAHFHLKTS